jgi:hypothetical protein
MRVLGADDSSRIGVDLVMMLRTAGHQAGGQNVTWTAIPASAPTGRTLPVARLPQSVAYPCYPENVR